jgi:membrane protein YdbS with pleckstrin-like domain
MTWYEPEADWTYADRRLIAVRWIVLWVVVTFLMVDFLIFSFVFAREWIVGTFIAAALGVWFTWVIYRGVTAHAWAEREDDLIVKRGRLWRSVTVVPYGRMQFVEVSAGPLSRAFGLASIQLHTASPGTDAALHGVRAADAETLRDRMTSRGESRLAGL